jgi:hypothetical protein
MMLIENSFQVAASPDRVFEFLQDAHNVVACFPGAELTEDLGDDTYKGKVKIKVGPVTAAYAGIAKIVEKDPVRRVAVLQADGKDSKGNGSAKAAATMTVTADGDGSTVQLSTDLTISGKIAQFGRGIIADVSGRMVGELASRVRAQIESDNAEPTPEIDTAADPAAPSAPSNPAGPSDAQSSPGGPAGTTPAAGAATATPSAAPTRSAPAKAAPAEVAPMKASTILWSVLSGMVRRLRTRLRNARNRRAGLPASTEDS